MQETRRNLLVGAFMLTGLVALALLMAMFGEAPEWLGGAEWRLRIRVAQLRTAPEGTPVNLNGIQIGRVGALEFDNPARPDQGVSVMALIKDKYDVPSGAHAVVYEPVLGVGRGHIEILVPPEGGGAPLPRVDASILGRMSSMMHEVVPETLMSSVEKTVIQIGNFAEALTPVANDLHDLMVRTPVDAVDDPAQARRVVANLSTVIQRVDQAVKHFNDVLGDPAVKSALRESIDNLRQMSEDGKLAVGDMRETAATLRDASLRITAKAEQALDAASADVSELSRKSAPVLDNLAQLTANLSRASFALADGQGTAGKFLRDDRLYEKMVLFMDRFTELVNTVRRIAGKTERQGYLDLAVHEKSPLGPVPVRKNLYNPGAVVDTDGK